LVLVTLLEKVRRATQAEASSVALIEPATGDLVFRQAMGGATQAVIGLRMPPGEGVVGWVAQHRQSAKVDDATQDARVHSLPAETGFVTRSLVCVPLIVRDTVTGVLELVNSLRGHFTEDEVQLLESVAAQVVMVIENARLFETEHTARERLETLYRVGQAINSTLDADVILDRLTDEAVLATGASHGSALVAHLERGVFKRRSLRGYTAEQAEQARRDALPLERGVNGRAFRLQQPVYIDDVTSDPDYHPLIATTRSELAVPIVRGGQVIGNLDLQSPLVGAFHHIDLPFLQALTDQVAIALENARLFAETRRQMDELTIVSQVALVGAAGRPFDETVARATDALSRLWPEADLGFLFVDEHRERLRMHPSYINPGSLEQVLTSITLDQGLAGWAVQHQQPLRVGDVRQDGRYVERSANIRSEMVAPLVVGEQAVGVVNAELPEVDAFSGDDLRLLTTLAGQLAVIFEKARLDAALAEHTALLEQRVEERTAEIRRQQARTQEILDALRESETLYHSLVEVMPQNVCRKDLAGRFTFANHQFLSELNWTLADLIGKTDYDIHPLEQAEKFRRDDRLVIDSRQILEFVEERAAAGGRPIYVQSVKVPILNSAGEVNGVQITFWDVSERKRAEEEMRRALEKERELNVLKSQFVSLTSHEFRTPLTAILSSAEMLEHYGERWSVERRLEHLQRIQTAVKYMTGLLNDILVVAKAEANRLEFVPEPLDVVKFCRDMMEEFELADRGQHPLTFASVGPCGGARLDQQLLRHILSNLLTNALKYSPPGNPIEFNLTCGAGQVVLRIQDHGMGIPQEDQARLFETFHRARNARNIPGTGLGLTIVKRSVDLHGGTIEVQSEENVGTTVTVCLPIGA
jgi:PAS domain S-box-containing protein